MERRSERRLVTSVFIDIVGSTALGQRLGPERMQRVLSESFAKISSFALSEGGTIEKYIGDESPRLRGVSQLLSYRVS